MPYLNQTIYESGSGSGSYFNPDDEGQSKLEFSLEVVLVLGFYFMCAGLVLKTCYRMDYIDREIDRRFMEIIIVSNTVQEGSVIERYLNERNVDTDETCPICLQDNKGMIKTDCDHVFCKECIKKWLDNNNSCPCCRKDLI